MKHCTRFRQLADQATRDITRRMTGLELRHTEPFAPTSGQELLLSVHGDYEMDIRFWIEESLLWQLARRMGRGSAVDEELALAYLTEYANILGGSIISSINRETKRSARFGIPRPVAPGQAEPPHDAQRSEALCYRCDSGRFRIFFLSPCAESS